VDDLPPPSVDELVQHWHQRREQGETLSLHELCAGAPEKVDELRQHLQAVAAMESFLGVNRSGSERTLAAPPSGVNGAGPPPAGLPTAPPGYEIVGELGRGAMGVVYQARQVGLNRPVALKMVLAGRHASERDLARFRSEAEAVARVQHPNIVQVHEIGEHQGIPFFSLEYCPGGNLDRKLSGQPLAPPEATRLVEALARAVQAAHDQAVIHRDLKPSNVLLAADGTPKVSDFGLAKRLNESGQTASGAILGTPSYMAPEQALGQNAAVGPAADVYALGAILYECLTGRPPFRAATTMDTLAQVVRQEPVSLRHLNAGVPRDLETVCLRCLQKEPARRYESARALAEDLERYRKGEPVRARPVGALERGRRWCRRNPVVAGSLLAVALSLLLGSVVSVVFAPNKHAVTSPREPGASRPPGRRPTRHDTRRSASSSTFACRRQ
jgi:serine/threonine protein kinase